MHVYVHVHVHVHMYMYMYKRAVNWKLSRKFCYMCKCTLYIQINVY